MYLQECETLLGRGTKRDRNGPVVVKVVHKLCRRCNVDKEAGQFFQSKLSLDGLCTYCKVGAAAGWCLATVVVVVMVVVVGRGCMVAAPEGAAWEGGGGLMLTAVCLWYSCLSLAVCLFGRRIFICVLTANFGGILGHKKAWVVSS